MRKLFGVGWFLVSPCAGSRARPVGEAATRDAPRETLHERRSMLTQGCIQMMHQPDIPWCGLRRPRDAVAERRQQAGPAGCGRRSPVPLKTNNLNTAALLRRLVPWARRQRPTLTTAQQTTKTSCEGMRRYYSLILWVVHVHREPRATAWPARPTTRICFAKRGHL